MADSFQKVYAALDKAAKAQKQLKPETVCKTSSAHIIRQAAQALLRLQRSGYTPEWVLRSFGPDRYTQVVYRIEALDQIILYVERCCTDGTNQCVETKGAGSTRRALPRARKRR